MGDEDKANQRRQVLTSGFWLGKHTVTQAQWLAVTGTKADCSFDGGELPADSVSHDMAQEFVKQSRRWLPEAWELNLPTEAQWEWACRAGSSTRFAVGTGNTITSQIANINGNKPDGKDVFMWLHRKTTVAVGSFPPNAWGLHDMHGQVWEWCRDWHAPLPPALPLPPDHTGPATGSARVSRGGSWQFYGRHARSASRNGASPDIRFNYYGFRVCLSSILSFAGNWVRSETESHTKNERKEEALRNWKIYT